MEVSVLSHVTNSAIVIYGLQYLKGTQWYRRFAAWMPIADRKVHILMSAVGAAVGTLGMHGAMEGSAVEGWKIALSIPPLWIMAHAAWDWAQQMALNQVGFALTVQQKEAAPVVTAAVTPKISVTVPVDDAGVVKP